MFETLSAAAEIVLFTVTIFWACNKPTVKKTATMICIVAVCLIGINSAYAMSQGSSVFALLLENYNQSMDAYADALASQQIEIPADQLASVKDLLSVLAGCWFGIYVLEATLDVLAALCLMWIIRKLFKHNSGWGAFSAVDLPVSVVSLLIVGLLAYAASRIPGLPQAGYVELIGYNVLIIGAIPVLIQGAAVGKGLMNKVRFGAIAQAVITVLLLISGLFPFVVGVLGIVDFWANLRGLPRDEVETAQ